MYGLLLLYVMVVLLFTFVIFMLTFDISANYKDSDEYYNYNYTTWFKIFVTLLLGITTNNTPDLALGDPHRRTLYVAFYFFYTLFNLLMANGIILAIVNQKYRETFEEEMNEDKGLTENHLAHIE